MKIALIHYSAPPVVGGVESVLAHHARLLASAGHSVCILAARGESWTDEIKLFRLPLVDSLHPDILAVKHELDAGRIPSAFASLVETLADQIRTAVSQTDVLIAHNVCSLNKNLVLTEALHRLSLEPKFPHLILWHHDLAWATPRYLPELHPGFPWALLRTDWPGATQVVVSAARQSELATLLGITPERIHVVPNGVDVAEFLKLEDQTIQLLNRLNLLQAAPIMLLPARITPRKNIELGLRTLACLRETFPAAVMIVTGPIGAHNPANRKYFKELLALRDHLNLNQAAFFLAEIQDALLPDSVIADFYRLADALFLPSREEGFGIPLLEAALSHRPIFCADLPVLRELGGEYAFYFSPNANPTEVASLVTRHIQCDPAFHLATAVRRDFNWERIYKEKIGPLLESVLPHRAIHGQGS